MRSRSTWRVPSRTREGVAYEVEPDEDGVFRCSCPGFAYRATCYHVALVLHEIVEVVPPQQPEQGASL
jgi:hypothetical protein